MGSDKAGQPLAETFNETIALSNSGIENLNRRHHSAVLVFKDMAMIDELADDHWIFERHQKFHITLGWDVDRVLVPYEGLLDAVDIDQLKVNLMNGIIP